MARRQTCRSTRTRSQVRDQPNKALFVCFSTTISVKNMEEMQNVNTQRRRQLSLDCQDSEYELDISYQSLPNNMNKDEIATIKDQLTKLNLELQIANTEIDNLNIENSALKEKLSTCQHKIKMYKSVGAFELNRSNKLITSPLKFYSPQYQKRHRSCGMRIGLTRTSSKELEIDAVRKSPKHDDSSSLSYFFEQPLADDKGLQDTMINHQPSYRPILEKGSMEMGTIVDYETTETVTIKPKVVLEHINKHFRLNNNISSNSKSYDLTTRKHQVKIFSDQAGLNMRSLLQDLLGNSFKVTSLVKPGAPMAEVLSTCVAECKDFTSLDYILILGGSNDSNPLNLQSTLYHTLSQIRHSNVLVGKIYKNRYLSVNMLNNSLKLVCSNFVNSIFLPLDQDHFRTKLAIPKYINTIQASRLIHKEILRLKYRHDFVNYIKIKSNDQYGICGEAQKCYVNNYTQTDIETSSRRFLAVTNSIGTQTDDLGISDELFRT